MNKHRTNKVFDFQFTDNVTALGNYEGGVAFNTLSDLHTAGEIIFLVDFSVGTVKNLAGANASIGDSIGNMYSILPGGTTIDYTPVGSSVIEYVVLNSDVNGLSGDSTWEAIADQTNSNNPQFTTESGFTFLFKASSESLEMLHKIGSLKIYRYNGTIQVHPAVSGGYTVMSASLTNSRNYIVQLWWSMTNESGGTYDMALSCRVWNVSLETMSSTMIATFPNTPNFSAYRISSAQTHIRAVIGLFSVHKNTESTRNTIMEYFQDQSTGEESGIPNAVDAEFNITLQIK